MAGAVQAAADSHDMLCWLAEATSKTRLSPGEDALAFALVALAGAAIILVRHHWWKFNAQFFRRYSDDPEVYEHDPHFIVSFLVIPAVLILVGVVGSFLNLVSLLT
jgi:hypothetical protein